MPDTSLSKRLAIKPGHRLLVLNAPEGYVDALGELPDGVELATSAEGTFDFVQVFTRSTTELDDLGPTALGALKLGGVLWFSYPKKSSQVETDITRDVGWDSVKSAGMRPVSQVSIDETWSALRFRPVDDVKPRKAAG